MNMQTNLQHLSLVAELGILSSLGKILITNSHAT